MIKQLTESIGLERLFVIDSNTFVDSKNNQFTDALHESFLRLKDIKREAIDKEILKVAESTYLLNNARIVVVSEVREELRGFASLINDKIRGMMRIYNNLDTMSKRRLDDLGEYLDALSELKKQLYGLDPRENEFKLDETLRIDRNAIEYQKIVETCKERLIEILKKRGKIRSNETQKLTDAKMFAVAYTLAKRGNDVCILSRDMDIRSLALDIEPNTILERSCVQNCLSRVYNQATGYDILIFNSHAAESRRPMSSQSVVY